MAKDKNMNQDAANDEEMTVTLTLDDGTDLECVVLTIFEAADKEYIALLPLDGNEAEDGEVYLYRYTEDADEPHCFSGRARCRNAPGHILFIEYQ